MFTSLLRNSVLILLVLSACTGKSKIKEKDVTHGIISYIEYAERFDLKKFPEYKILTVINPWQGAKEVNESYYLLPEGNRIPAGIDSSRIIRVPVKSIICMSTTHLSMISVLNEEKTIRGISGSDFLYERKLSELVEKHKIEDVGYEDNLNKELVIQIAPEIVMVYGVGSESAGYLNKLKELGIRIIFNADYLETDPLGKAEWIKVFGALYNKEKEADSIFSSLSEEYNSLKSYVNKNIRNRPAAFLGLPWKDTWFISPGNSYISRLITDAGGEYLWKDTKSEISMPFGIENVYLKARNADFWLNPGSVNTRNEITAIDMRLGDLPSFKRGNVFNNNNRITRKGGNDYWESGSIYPQIILKDIAAILHPDLFPGYKLYYYKKIE
jgi:iron complex transport system substrate-binding protein